MPTVRDKLWIFTCVAGSDNPSLEKGGFPEGSRMTPAEGAFYLGVPNLQMIRWEGLPAYPYDQYAEAFSPLKQVVWSIVGSGGREDEEELERVLELAERYPNVTGIYMDDFIRKEGEGVLTPEDLKGIRPRLKVGGRRLDLWVVVYIRQLDLPIFPLVEQCDIVNLWTWNSEQLVGLAKNLDRLEKLKPGGRVSLGCYLWDFHNARPVSVKDMEHQCGLGLKWLQEGRIESMSFLANTVMDIKTESPAWTRDWIQEVGDIEV
ncbi:MAG: hypothetical protein QGI83_07835 [Candidatus Latescibacteria bacterium]|jgi:hypothetical protein|nr:hypothetical protein [Candidatus Latescibacterota bacterium]